LAKGKFTRKDLKGPDEFISTTTHVLEWLAKRRKQVILFLGAVVVVGAGLWTWKHFASKSQMKAADAFSEAVQVYQRPLKGDLGIDEKNEQQKPFADAKERAKAALEKFEGVVTQHPNTDVARLAKLYIGNCRLALGEYDKAVESFSAYLADNPKDSSLRALALENLGYAFENKKDYAKAIESFEKLGQESIFSERGLYHVARVHKLQGNREKAKEFFQKALEKAKQEKLDWFAEEIEGKLALLELEP
jgi:tetratricopeptide (TPR) repeat protein